MSALALSILIESEIIESFPICVMTLRLSEASFESVLALVLSVVCVAPVMEQKTINKDR